MMSIRHTRNSSRRGAAISPQGIQTPSTVNSRTPRSPSSTRRRQLERIAHLSNREFDEDDDYESGSLLKTRPDLMSAATEQEAAKLQAALEGSSIDEHFTKFVTDVYFY